MATLDVENVDLAVLLDVVRAQLGEALAGSVVGRTQMRNAVAEHLACSALEAEQLVDTMVSRGMVRLDRDAEGREVWLLSKGPGR